MVVNPEKLPLSPMDKKFLKAIFEIANSNLSHQEFGPHSFAKEMGISRAHLNRKVKKLLGYNTRQLILELRLEKAAKLLKQKGVKISEIAYDVGFSHLSYFAKTFKNKFGKSPGEFRKIHIG